MKRLKHAKVCDLPATWRGKRYRRAEAAGDTKAQQKAEEKERLLWAKKVVDLLVEAKLPFGVEVSKRNLAPDSAETSRCLRGLRGSSLKKRLCDWAPARRFLLAETGLPFPVGPGPLLHYFEARRKVGAARTTYGSVLEALRFLEKQSRSRPRTAYTHSSPWRAR